MRFYRIDAPLNNPTAWKRRYEKPADRQALMEEIGAAAQRYNADRSVFERFYPTALSKDRFSFCAAAEGIVSQPDGTAFLRELDERFGKISVTEIGFGTFREALKRGDRKDLLDDADDIFKELGLEKLNDSFGHYYLDCGEGLLKKTGNTFPGLIRKAKQAMVGDSLIPELERIREGKTRTDYPGHPVHYFVETADKDLRKTLTHLLMQGLLLRKRIQNLRYTYLDVPADWNYSKEGFEELYKSSKGGVVLIRYNGGVEEDGACAGAELATINAISDMARRYRNQVLTVFCMFRGQQTSKRLLLEKIRDLRIVELKEDLVTRERAEEQLRACAAKRGLPVEPALLDRLKGSDVFYASELNKLFEEWFNDQLCTGIFPQYNGFALSAKPPSGGTGTAVAELNAMIGLTEAKAVLRQVLDYHLVKQIFKDRNIPQDFPCAHMVFTGNPGTAKTTAARLFARALKENGILPTGHLVEVGRSDLVGQYVGWTAVQVKKKFEDAKGGVLFIDEAYSLTDDQDGSFGDEAINTIVQEMENHRHEMIVILAGYPDRMETFLDKNPGLRSRIAFHVPFKDYSEEELCDISRMIAEKQGCILSDTFTDRLPDLFRVAKGAPDFGNGRYVRNLLEQAKMNHATRILQMDRAAVTETALRTLSAEDLPAPQPPRAVPVRKIGFGV